MVVRWVAIIGEMTMVAIATEEVIMTVNKTEETMVTVTETKDVIAILIEEMIVVGKGIPLVVVTVMNLFRLEPLVDFRIRALVDVRTRVSKRVCCLAIS